MEAWESGVKKNLCDCFDCFLFLGKKEWWPYNQFPINDPDPLGK